MTFWPRSFQVENFYAITFREQTHRDWLARVSQTDESDDHGYGRRFFSASSTSVRTALIFAGS
jgi:hypothetical protein